MSESRIERLEWLWHDDTSIGALMTTTMRKLTGLIATALALTTLSASARIQVPVVPEPSTYAAGAALVGILAVIHFRRRRNR